MTNVDTGSAEDLAKIEEDSGDAAMKAGKYEESLVSYSLCVCLVRDVSVLRKRAAAYMKLEFFKGAERDCEMVLREDPRNVDAQFLLAEALHEQGKDEECVAVIAKLQTNAAEDDQRLENERVPILVPTPVADNGSGCPSEQPTQGRLEQWTDEEYIQRLTTFLEAISILNILGARHLYLGRHSEAHSSFSCCIRTLELCCGVTKGRNNFSSLALFGDVTKSLGIIYRNRVHCNLHMKQFDESLHDIRQLIAMKDTDSAVEVLEKRCKLLLERRDLQRKLSESTNIEALRNVVTLSKAIEATYPSPLRFRMPLLDSAHLFRKFAEALVNLRKQYVELATFELLQTLLEHAIELFDLALQNWLRDIIVPAFTLQSVTRRNASEVFPSVAFINFAEINFGVKFTSDGSTYFDLSEADKLMRKTLCVELQNYCETAASLLPNERERLATEFMQKTIKILSDTAVLQTTLKRAFSDFERLSEPVSDQTDAKKQLCVPLSMCTVALDEAIGKGACGRVFKAYPNGETRRSLDCQSDAHAVKVLQLNLSGEDALETLDNIRAELLSTTFLPSSPNLNALLHVEMTPWLTVNTDGCVTVQYCALMLMELQSMSLATWCRKRNQGELEVSAVQAVKIILDIVSALANLHSFAICHGDLHLGNVLVSVHPTGSELPSSCLSDFGCSQILRIASKSPPTSRSLSASSDKSAKQRDLENLGMVIAYTLFILPEDDVYDMCSLIQQGKAECDAVQCWMNSALPVPDIVQVMKKLLTEPMSVSLAELIKTAEEYLRTNGAEWSAMLCSLEDFNDVEYSAANLLYDTRKLLYSVKQLQHELALIMSKFSRYPGSAFGNHELFENALSNYLDRGFRMVTAAMAEQETLEALQCLADSSAECRRECETELISRSLFAAETHYWIASRYGRVCRSLLWVMNFDPRQQQDGDEYKTKVSRFYFAWQLILGCCH